MITFNDCVLRNGTFELRADLSLDAGKTTAVIGASGSGKSTFLMALAGFVPVSHGAIHVAGKRIDTLSPAARPVSILFQDHNLFAHLDVERNVALGLRPDLRLTAEDRRAIAKALANVGLGGMERRRPEELSGGQQQRVALARTLLRDKPVLLLDEPFAALGPGLRLDMLDLVARLTAERGLTTLMVTHDPQDAARIAAEAVVVGDGQASAPHDLPGLLADPPPDLGKYLGHGR